MCRARARRRHASVRYLNDKFCTMTMGGALHDVHRQLMMVRLQRKWGRRGDLSFRIVTGLIVAVLR